MNTRSIFSRGFSLIEVMVTIVVVAFGLLGIASLLLRGLQAGATSQTRSIAVSQAYDIVERMRSNMTYVNDGSYNDVVPTGSASTCAALLAKITDNDDSTIPIVAAPSTATTCTGTGVAHEKNCWQADNFSKLPSGAGAVCRNTTNASNRWYAVIVSWDENRSGATNKSFWTIIEP